ncbi:MAG: amidohydrolase family protein [Gammaproteobacteria bacterium]|nr:amidohydrolase family protein [Gammaproteobacteria bacterium]
MPASDSAPLCAAPDPRPQSPGHAVPDLACDTHMHICGPESRFTYSRERIYTPPDALLPSYLELTDKLGIGRVVFVQPSIYGTDNSAMLDAMHASPLPCRGVAVVADDVNEQTLNELHEAGVRGVRLNLVDTADKHATLPVDDIRALAERVAPLGWHIELLLHADDHPQLDTQLADLPIDVVFGHLGYLRPGAGTADPGFQALLRLLEAGRCWVKLTGPYRLTREALPYAAVQPFAQALIRTAPERLLWGSDWPHVMVKTPMPNDGQLLDLFFAWADDVDIGRRILVDNPADLYDF